jgi:6-phospho-beta-glucosidase
MKLALIGGGGVRTIFFTQSLCKYAARLGIDELVIMDNNPRKLNIYGNLAAHIASVSESGLDVELTDNVVRAVMGADYVVTTMRVAEDQGRILDERIALSHGIIGQETTGPGGFSYALRTIPVVRKYCELIREHSHNALIFNFTNPSGLVTQAMHSFGHHNVIGICDGPTHLETEIARTLGLNVGDVSARIYGLNHLSWLYGYQVKGIDIIGGLLASDAFLENSTEFGHFDKEVIRYVRGIPSSYLYYYYNREEAVQNVLKSGKTRGEVITALNNDMNDRLEEIGIMTNPEQALAAYYKVIEERERSYMSIELQKRKRETKALDFEKLGIGHIALSTEQGEAFEGYSGVAFNYIDALKNDTGITIPISVPNNGAIPEMKDEDVLEITCRVDAAGAHPIAPGEIPESNLLLMRQVKLFERMTVQAVAEKSKDIACLALLNHPLVGSYSLAKALVKDYTKAFEPYFVDWK